MKLHESDKARKESFNELTKMYIKNIQQYHSTNKAIETMVAKKLGLSMNTFRNMINFKNPIWKIILKARNESCP